MDEILGVSGEDDSCGDASEGPAWYGLIRRSGSGRGGYILTIDSQGFHYADEFDTDAALDAAWAGVQTEDSGLYA